VFERYWTGDDHERRGTGLGLPIARALVAGHGGELGVESPLGGGATFTFALPTATGLALMS
jgi:signal transduction histidine kinase